MSTQLRAQSTLAPYGLDVVQTCVGCSLRGPDFFCDMAPQALADFDAIRQFSVYPTGAMLFVEGQAARGVFLVCSGRVKLTITSREGQTLILRVPESGEMLGLSAVIEGAPYDSNCETIEPSRISFLPQADFLRFLQKHGAVTLRVAAHLARELRRAHRQAASLALPRSASAKLASLLLDRVNGSSGTTFRLHLTHEEIGDLIGCTRETVTRLLGEFKKRGLIQMQSGRVAILDKAKMARVG